MDIIKLSRIWSADVTVQVQYTQDHGLLRKEAFCGPCQRPYSKITDSSESTGSVLWCPGCR